MRGSSSRTAVRDYLARRPDCAGEIAGGADAFMDGYGRFFTALTGAPTSQKVAWI